MDENNLLFATARGEAVAYTVGDSVTLQWSGTIQTGSFWPSIIVCSKDKLFVGYRARVKAFDLQNGKTLWKKSLHTDIGQSVDLLLFNSTSKDRNYPVLLVGSSGYVFMFSVDGEKIWELDLQGSLYTTTTLTCSSDTIFAATSGHVWAISLDGNLLWCNPMPGYNFSGISICVLPPSGDDNSSETLVAGAFGYLVQLNVGDGKKIREHNLEGTGFGPVTLLYAQHTLFTFSSGHVSAHDPTNLSVIWKNPMKGLGIANGASLLFISSESKTEISSTTTTTSTSTASSTTTSTITNKETEDATTKTCESLLVVGFNDYVVALDSKTGNRKWILELSTATHDNFVTLLYSNEKIWAGSAGKLNSVDPLTGVIIATHTVTSEGSDDVWLATPTTQLNQQSSNFLVALDSGSM